MPVEQSAQCGYVSTKGVRCLRKPNHAGPHNMPARGRYPDPDEQGRVAPALNARLLARTPTERFMGLLASVLAAPCNMTPDMLVRLEDAFNDAVDARVEEARNYAERVRD